MSDISITGNEAQFNENVTFLKDVNIGGFLSLPDQNLDLNNLSITGQISGNPNLSISAGFLTVTTEKIKITGFTTFTSRVEFKDDVLFNQALSFPSLEVRDEFRVGSGGTVITADSFLNPGRVGIGSSAPTELLDVGGKAKIIDLDLRNLNVAGFSTFNDNIDVNANVDISGSLDVNNYVSIGQTLGVGKEVTIGNTLNVSGISTFEDNVKITGTGNLIIEGSGPQVIRLLDDTGADGIQIAYRTTPDEFTIENQADGSKFFLADRDNGQVELYNSNVKRLETTGVGITVFGDIIVPDVGIRTSRVGLGTTNPVYITNQLNDAGSGPLRLAIDGSVAITRNIYDSAGSPGENGFFLNRDANGIRWVSFEPAFTEGIFIQDEGSFIPTVGAAQSFTIINFVRKNSDGEGTDTLIPTASNPTTQTGLSTIFTQDFWGFVGSDIYRMTNVGIGSSVPNAVLDVLGNSKFVGITTFNGITTSIGDLFANQFLVSGVSTFSDNIFVEATTDTNQLNVSGLSTFVGISTFKNLTFTNQIQNIGIITSNIIHLTGDTFSAPVQSPGDTLSDAAIIVNENFHIYTLEVGGRRLRNLIEKTDDNITIGQQNTSLISSIQLKPGASGTVRLHYGSDGDNIKFETSGIGATVYGQLDTINLNVAGVSTFADDIFIGVGATVGFGTTAYFRDDAKLSFGNDEDLHIFSHSGNSYVDGRLSNLNLRVNEGKQISLRTALGAFGEPDDEVLANFIPNSTVELFFDGAKRIETTNEGILVSGGTTTRDFRATGVSTFQDNIFVEATTDTNQLNVTGVSTFKDDVEFHGVSGITSVFFDQSDNSLNFVDNARLKIGDSGDLQLYHNTLNSWILDQGTGDLVIGTNGEKIRISKGAGAESLAEFRIDSSVDLYYDDTQRFSTSGIGATVFGQLDTTNLNVTGVSTFQDDIFVGVGATVGFGTTSYFRDNARAVFGDNENLAIYFNGNNSVIEDQGSGNTILSTNGNGVFITKNNGSASIADFRTDESVILYHDGNEKFKTTNEGILVSGGTTTRDFKATGVSTFSDDIFVGTGATVGFGTTAYFRDNARAVFGDGEDLEIYHDSNESVIKDAGTGMLKILASTVNIKNANDNSLSATFQPLDAASLFYSGSKKLETTNEGILVSGGTTTGDFKATGVSTFVGVSTFSSNIFVEATTDTNQLNVSGVSTFSGTVDIDSTVKDRNDSVGTTVAENLSNPITDVDYNSTTGIMEIEIANHGFANGDSIQIPDGTITLSCNYKGTTINQSYPRSKDPNSGKWLVISNVTTDTFQVDVGDGGLAAGITHNFVSASGGVLHSSGQYVEYDYRLASVGTGVSWRPSGVQTKRTIWVSKSGSDSNSGLLEGDAKATIGAAASIAIETDTIKIRPGLYIEDNPIGLRTDVSVTGEDLRLVTVQSKNKNKDVFHVRRGCLIENLNFGGSNVGVSHAGAACVAFPTPAGADSAVTGYTEPGPATEGPSGRWRSPYVRNCTNFMTDSIGLKVDGDNATASTIGGDLKSMVVDSYTQYNENGIGVSLTNNGYAQLVSIFTISCDIGIFATSGAQCDLTNSNSSFGNFGLVAVGLGSTQFTGIVSNTNVEGDLIGSTIAEGQDTVVCANVRDLDGIERRPFDGQSLFFKIKASNYPDVNVNNLNAGTFDGDGRIKSPLQQLRSINLIATGSDLEGFSAIDPPSVLIRDADGEVEPKGPQGIIAEAVADVDATGKLVGIDVIAQGRNYFSGQNIVVDVEGNIGLATAVMEPIFFTVESSTENPIGSIGIATVTFNEFVPYELFPDDPFSLQRISRILTSSHSFEYVGAGTDINISTPLQGAIPIKANEIVAKDGAQIPFTSTDQQGNFDIGQGLQINQTTSSITGRDFSRSIQAQVTPLILALR